MNFKNEDINNAAFQYCQAAAPQIAVLCQPFFSKFGLETFIYGRFFHDGKYLLLTTHVEWAKNWLQTIHSIENTALLMTLRNVPMGDPFYFLWSTAPNDKLIQLHNHFGIYHGFDIGYRLDDSVEAWAFCTRAEQEQINNFYLNNVKLFHRFCFYFREHAASLLAIKERSQLATLDGGLDISFQPSFLSTEEINSFMSSFPVEGCSLSLAHGQVRLSKRELECVFYLSQGKTSKEIGRLLAISPRTVESYIMATKHKTRCNTKTELIENCKSEVLKWL